MTKLLNKKIADQIKTTEENTDTVLITEDLNTEITEAKNNLVTVINGSGSLTASLNKLIDKIAVFTSNSIGLDSSVKPEDMTVNENKAYKKGLKDNGTSALNQFMHEAISEVKNDDQTFAEWLKIKENSNTLNTPKTQIMRRFNKLYKSEDHNWTFSNITEKKIVDGKTIDQWTGNNKLVLNLKASAAPQTKEQTAKKIKAAKTLLKAHKIPVGKQSQKIDETDREHLVDTIIRLSKDAQVADTSKILKAIVDHYPTKEAMIEDVVLNKNQRIDLSVGREVRLGKFKHQTNEEQKAATEMLKAFQEICGKSKTGEKIIQRVTDKISKVA